MLLSTIGSALFAALVAIGATVAIERFGGVVGGLLGSIPTTIIPASIGFWLTQNEVVGFQAALYTVPVGMMVKGLAHSGMIVSSCGISLIWTKGIKSVLRTAMC